MPVSALNQALWGAEARARERDLRAEINIDLVANELRKADEAGLRLIRERQKSPVPFVQVIEDNLNYIVESEYLSTSELAFLMCVMGRAEMHSNAIVNADGRYMTISALAESTKYSVRQARSLISSLIEKGIIFEFIDGNQLQQVKRHGRVIEERPLYLNPELIFKGDRNRINATLCRLVMNADPLERRKILLPWKMWLEPGAEYGRLLRRKTWLKKRKEEKP